MRGVSPATVNHGICYCHDCRAFAHWLGHDDRLVEAGGTPIVQIARARLHLEHGLDQVRLMRLTPRGLHRFHTACCRSPVGNTMPSLPFLGVVRSMLDVPEREQSATFGPWMALARGSALGPPPRAERGDLVGLAHVTRMMAGWALRGLGRPTQLLDARGEPTVPSQILTPLEREALRARPDA